MPRQFSIYNSTDTTLVTSAETVVATLTGTSTNQSGQSFGLRGEVTLTTGGSTTGVTLRVRRDSLTGTLVGEASADAVEAAAGSVETHDIYVEESAPGEFSGRTYVLTAAQIGAAANGTVSQASLVATATP